MAMIIDMSLPPCMFNFLHFPIFRKFYHHPIGIIINIKKFVNLGGLFSSGLLKLFFGKVTESFMVKTV